MPWLKILSSNNRPIMSFSGNNFPQDNGLLFKRLPAAGHLKFTHKLYAKSFASGQRLPFRKLFSRLIQGIFLIA
jgi:hypothetical protein